MVSNNGRGYANIVGGYHTQALRPVKIYIFVFYIALRVNCLTLLGFDYLYVMIVLYKSVDTIDRKD